MNARILLLLAASAAAFAQSRMTLECGTPATGSFSQGTVDFFDFTAAPGDVIMIRAAYTAPDPSFSIRISVIDPLNRAVTARPILANYGATVLGEYELPVGGPYQLRVENRTPAVSGTYQLMYTFLNRPCGQSTLTCGQGVSAQLARPLQVHVYQFNMTAGDLLSLRVAKYAPFTTGSGILAAVYDGAGRALTNASTQLIGGLIGASGSTRLDFRPPVTGPINVVVFDRAAAQFTDNYAISITRLNGGCGSNSVTCGAVNQGRIQTVLGAETFAVPLIAGDVVTIKTAATGTGGLSPLVEVYEPDGTPAPAPGSGQAGSAALTFSFTARVSGNYLALVRDGATTANTGSFAITLLRHNRPCTGATISCGSLVDGSINGVLGANIYTMQAAANDVFLLRIARTGLNASFRPRIEIFDPKAVAVQSVTVSESGRVTFTTNIEGSYTVIVSDASDAAVSGGYSLSLERLNRPCNATPLTCGQPVTGSFSRQLTASVMSYTAAPGESFTVRMVDRSGELQPSLEVYDPKGSATGIAISGSYAGVDVTQPAGGTYTIIATDTSTRGTGGAFLVELVRTVESCGTSLPAGQNVSGLITGPAPFAIYRIPAKEGDSLLLRSASYTAGFAASMELYDPSGRRLDAQTFRIARTATATGNYTLIVAPSGGRTGGAFSLAWQTLNRPAGTQPLACGATTSAGLSGANAFRFYSASAAAGDLMRILLARTSDNFAPQIELFDPAGARLASTADISQRAAADGDYLVLVSPSSSVGETGSFAVAYQRPNNPCNPASLTCGQTTLRHAAIPGQLDTFTFTGTPGNRANLRLTLRTGDYSPFAELYDATGTRLASSASGSVTATLSAGGPYSLLVRDRLSTGLGSYRVTLQDDTNVCRADDQEAPALTLLDPTGGEVIAGGSSFQVQWLSDDNVGVASHEVALSTDGGATFPTVIAPNLSGNAQSFAWSVPPDIAPSRIAAIRVTAKDAAGNAKAAASGPLSIIGSGFTPTSTTTFEYDGLNRVTKVIGGVVVTYTWDAAGNLVAIAVGQ